MAYHQEAMAIPAQMRMSRHICNIFEVKHSISMSLNGVFSLQNATDLS